MARLESKSLSVSPEMEHEAIETYQKFGWELKSSQEIFNKDSHQELRGDSVYSVTETTNYVKLVFQRDKDMPYYNEVCEIEDKYFDLLNHKPIYYFGHGLLILGFLLAIVCGFLSIICILGGEIDIVSLLFCAPLTALGVFIIVRRIKTRNRLNAEYSEHMKTWNNECSMLIAEVENYV